MPCDARAVDEGGNLEAIQRDLVLKGFRRKINGYAMRKDCNLSRTV